PLFSAAFFLSFFYVLFTLSPYIILPHARPEQGVNKNAISVLLLKHSVYYENSREPIRLIVVLASTDSVSHLVMLKKVAEILNKENNVSDILESETIRELYEKFA
ncbi:PTS sugar transporter subunit IIA, partial [Holdemanella biformis]|uniref:PTS sugar transporter subunit IIA n=1 Tax=Holdemanella biformis TaxID=1735 RepID=UPI0022E72D2C